MYYNSLGYITYVTMTQRSPSPQPRSFCARSRSRSRSPTCRPVAPYVPSPKRYLDRLPRLEYTTPPLSDTATPGTLGSTHRYLSEEHQVSQQQQSVRPVYTILALLQERHERRLTALQAYQLYVWLSSRHNPGRECYTRALMRSVLGEGVRLFAFQPLYGTYVCEGYTLALYLARYYGLSAPGTVTGSWGANAVSATFRILDVITAFRAQRRATTVIVDTERPTQAL